MTENTQKSNDIRTLMGFTIQEVITILDEPLEDSAYSKIGGVPGDFTDIKPAWLYQYLNNLFGVCGVGWWYDYDEIVTRNGTTASGKPTYIAEVNKLNLYYRVVIDGVITTMGPIPSNGTNENMLKPEWAAKGAITTALGSSASRMGWQLSVYQGKRSHNNKAVEGNEAWGENEQLFTFENALAFMTRTEKLDTAIAAAKQPDGFGLLTQLSILEGYKGNPVADMSKILGEAYPVFIENFRKLRELAALDNAAYLQLKKDMFEAGVNTIAELLCVWRVVMNIKNGLTVADAIKMVKAENINAQ